MHIFAQTERKMSQINHLNENKDFNKVGKVFIFTDSIIKWNKNRIFFISVMICCDL